MMIKRTHNMSYQVFFRKFRKYLTIIYFRHLINFERLQSYEKLSIYLSYFPDNQLCPRYLLHKCEIITNLLIEPIQTFVFLLPAFTITLKWNFHILSNYRSFNIYNFIIIIHFDDGINFITKNEIYINII